MFFICQRHPFEFLYFNAITDGPLIGGVERYTERLIEIPVYY